MLMRVLRFLNVAILSLLVGSAALVYAQDEKRQDDKQQEDKSGREEPKPKQDEAKPPRHDEAKPAKQDNRQDQKREDQSREQQMKPEEQNRPEQRQAEHARPAGKGGHIPDDKFKAHFGHDHHFRARGVIAQGQPQFQYGGYTFELVDVWPADWAYDDDCYIDYIDGEYFLFDLVHPGVRIALFVVL
jgi:hypothetical protein